MRLPIKKTQLKYRFDDVMEAIAMSAKNAGIEIVATQLGKSSGYLRSELTVTNSTSTHKLGFDDAISIMVLSEDYTALDRIADYLDLVIVPRNKTPLNGLSGQQKDFMLIESAAGAIKTIATAYADDELTEQERSEIKEALLDVEKIVSEALRNRFKH